MNASTYLFVCLSLPPSLTYRLTHNVPCLCCPLWYRVSVAIKTYQVQQLVGGFHRDGYACQDVRFHFYAHSKMGGVCLYRYQLAGVGHIVPQQQ